MHKIILTLAVTIFAASAFATPGCVTGTYTSYIALSGGGCTVGDAVFSNFSALSFVNSPGVDPLPSDDIEITPGGTPTAPTLVFVYTDGMGNSTPVTFSQNGNIFSFGLNYQLTPTGANLSSVQIASDFSNTSPGSVSATKNAQLLGGGPIYTSTVSDGGVSNSLSNVSGTVASVAGSGTWVISDTISLQAQTGGVVTQAGFTNLFDETPATTGEPLTAFLVGTGLFGLGFGARRRKRLAAQAQA